jgi:hypothetical protein
MKLLAAMLFAAGALSAGSVEPWVAGTRPYETVPYFELNAGGFADLGSRHRGGVRLDYGILDHWSLQGLWQGDDAPPAAQTWVLGTQLRLGEQGQYPLDLGCFAELRKPQREDGAGSDPSTLGGLLLAKELAGHSLSLNGAYSERAGWAFALGYRSPYLVSALQAGLEIEFGDAGRRYVPQLSLELPGDIALQCGAGWDAAGGDPSWLFSFSYELFPNP